MHDEDELDIDGKCAAARRPRRVASVGHLPLHHRASHTSSTYQRHAKLDVVLLVAQPAAAAVTAIAAVAVSAAAITAAAG